ncbi:MAG TPA: ATP-binding cassette domain-containing protein [Crinalium sp.]|jgi:ABC-2 type transport system ATP-binding protein
MTYTQKSDDETLAPSTLNSTVIHVDGLRKHYGPIEAVRGIDFTVQRGEIFGLIGPDGAGKTTTFQILAGVMDATAGNVQVLNRAPRDARLGIGYLTQQFSLYLDLSIDENLRYSAGLREVPRDRFIERRDRYLPLMGLENFGQRLAGQLSGGMKQKLALCCALISQPEILLLDEPTTGVDPVSRREFWDVLASLSSQGVTIVVATPYLDEAERCNRIALMYEGQLQQTGTLRQLRSALGLHRLEVRTDRLEATEQVLLDAIQTTENQGDIRDVQSFGDRLDVLVQSLDAGESDVRTILARHQLTLQDIQHAEATLENVFVTRLRQQGADPPFIPFPSGGVGGREVGKQRDGGGWEDRGDGGDREVSRNGSTPRTPHPTAIKTQHLRKVFGDFTAVKDVTLDVRYGEIYGLLGANGAGKTTTIKMLCGLLEPSGGEISLAGKTRDLRDPSLRQRIGYMSQKFTLYDDLTVVQNLEFYCGVYGVPRHQRRERIDWVLAICGLAGQETMMTGRLPGGWKQRVSFGASVMHEPKILFLDEPTSGVDPLARRQFWRLIEDFARRGTAILVTTHYLEEAEHCNYLGFLVAGEVVAQGSPTQIKAQQPGKLIEIVTNQTQAASDLLKTQMEPWRVSIFGDRLHVVLDYPEAEIPHIRQLFQDYSTPNGSSLELHSLRQVPFSLEDTFIGIVQRAEQPT